MAITYPFDLLDNFPGWSTQFELLWRQEQSRQANGRTIVKDFGSPLWIATYQTRQLKPNEMDMWRARLDAMENGLQTFYGRPLSRCKPIKHPGSTPIPNGTVALISADRKEVTLSGFPGISYSVGDMVRIGERDLHRIVGINGLVLEVRPHIWVGVSVGAVASIYKPYCRMTIQPGSISSTVDAMYGRGVISFQAVEAR